MKTQKNNSFITKQRINRAIKHLGLEIVGARGDVCAKLLGDIMTVHSVPDRDISEEEDEQMIAYDKMSDNELLELYKSEYDKLFDGENPEQQQKIVTQIYSAIKDRGNALASSASKYADYKRELER